MICLSFLLGTCTLFGVVIQSTAEPSAPTQGPETASHQAMVEVLRNVRERMNEVDPFLGTRELKATRKKIRELPEGTPVDERWSLLHQLGNLELRAGQVERAIVTLLQGLELVPQLPREVRRARAVESSFRVGMAYLRLGENQHCVAVHNAESCVFPIRGGGIHTDPRPSTIAMQHFHRVTKMAPPDSPTHVMTRWLLNIAAMTVGKYPEEVPDDLAIPAERFASPVPFPEFPNVAPELGLDTFNLSGGSVAEDLDGDGDIDLMNSSWDPSEPVRVFRNEDNQRFTEVTEAAGLSEIFGGLNLVHGDYDNDGDHDVLVLRGAWLAAGGQIPNSLLRNDGDCRFTDVTFAAGLTSAYPTQTAAFADYDLDGDLDLCVGNESGRGFSCPTQLFRNRGDGTFEDVTAEAGVANDREAKAVVFGDIDGDRDFDLFVSNLLGENRLYLNQGDGTFVDVAQERGVIHPLASFSSWFFDYDNDGDLDLYVSTYEQNIPAVAGSYLGLELGAEYGTLYRNDGKGRFEDVTESLGLGVSTCVMGSNHGDLDYDGFPDLYCATGFPDYAALMPNRVFWNRPGKGFVDVTSAGGFGHLQKGHAVSFVDFDGDGDLDVFQQLGGAFRGDGFHNALNENPGFGNAWIGVQLVGQQSDRFGVGARIRARVEVDGRSQWLHRWVSSGGSFGASPYHQPLGLGKATRVEELEVLWPTSDTTQRFVDLPVRCTIRVREGGDGYELVEH